jgi:S-adenosylmethionine-dependent methyltransferase
VLCHSVLEFVDAPAAAAAAVAHATRPAGAVSVLVANRNAVVLSRAASGQFAAARHALDDPDGRWGAADPVPRRFTLTEVSGLLAGAGLTVHAAHGVRVFADLVPGGLVESEPGAYEALRELEVAVAEHPAFRDIAPQLHLLAARG